MLLIILFWHFKKWYLWYGQHMMYIKYVYVIHAIYIHYNMPTYIVYMVVHYQGLNLGIQGDKAMPLPTIYHIQYW